MRKATMFVLVVFAMFGSLKSFAASTALGELPKAKLENKAIHNCALKNRQKFLSDSFIGNYEERNRRLLPSNPSAGTATDGFANLSKPTKTIF